MGRKCDDEWGLGSAMGSAMGRAMGSAMREETRWECNGERVRCEV